MPSSDSVDLVRAWIASARRVVVLTGAGISTESGIPDFRGPQGVWTTQPGRRDAVDPATYLADPKVRQAAWRSRMAHPAWTARPNRGHLALVELERRGKLHALITQNIDELHQMAGNSRERIVEVHGTVHRVMCWRCGQRSPMQEALERVRAGEEDPACRTCGGILKSDTISFGQAAGAGGHRRARCSAAGEADLLLAVGSTLQVYPVAGVVPLAKDAGARVVIMNAQPTAMDSFADALMCGPIGELLPAVCAE